MKKFSLTIHDLSGTDVLEIINNTNGENSAEITPETSITNVTNVTSQSATIAAAIEANLLPYVKLPETQAVVDAKIDAEIDAAEAVLDATGIPWDVRIHTSTKNKTAKGFWKRKPRIEDALFDSTVLELQAATPIVGSTAPATTPEFPTGIQAQDVPPVPAANIPPPPAAATEPVPAARDYNGLMIKIQQDFTAGMVNSSYPSTIVDRINAGFKTNVPTIVDISGNDEMVNYAWQCVDVDAEARVI